MTRARSDLVYAHREKRLLDDLATATLQDPRASREDLEAARHRLGGSDEAFSFARLTLNQKRELAALLAAGLGRAPS